MLPETNVMFSTFKINCLILLSDACTKSSLSLQQYFKRDRILSHCLDILLQKAVQIRAHRLFLKSCLLGSKKFTTIRKTWNYLKVFWFLTGYRLDYFKWKKKKWLIVTWSRLDCPCHWHELKNLHSCLFPSEGVPMAHKNYPAITLSLSINLNSSQEFGLSSFK